MYTNASINRNKGMVVNNRGMEINASARASTVIL